MVLTVSFVISPVTGLFCHRHFAGIILRTLAPASGRQDHTTSPSACTVSRLLTCRVHRIPLHVRDDRETPLMWERDGDSCKFDLGEARSGIFLRAGLDRFSCATPDLPVRQSGDASRPRNVARNIYHKNIYID